MKLSSRIIYGLICGIIVSFAVSILVHNIWLFLGTFLAFFALLFARHVNQNGWYYITDAEIIQKISKMTKFRKIKNSFKIPGNKLLNVEISTDIFESDKIIRLCQPLLNLSILEYVKKTISEESKASILESGHAQNPRILGLKSTIHLIIAVIICIPVGLILAVFVDILFVVIGLAPVFAIFSHIIHLKSKISERKVRIIDELPFFTTYASVMESVDIPLYVSLTSLGDDSSLFKIFSQDGLMVKRNVNYLGMGITQALQELATHHPNKDLQLFLRGYISIQATRGSGTVPYLQEASKRFFNVLKTRMNNYVKQAEMISQALLMIMIVLPLMTVSSILISSTSTVFTILMGSMFVVPFLAIILIIIIDAKQPKSRDSLNFHKLPVIAGAISCVICLVLGLKYWEILGIATISWSLLNVVLSSKQFHSISQIESALPYFLKDITEILIIGKDLFFAVEKIGSSRKYNKTLDFMINTINANMKSGDTFNQAMQSIVLDSWIGRITFFIIGKLHESGGGNSEILNTLSVFISEYYESKKMMLDSSKSALFMAYLGPIIMVCIAGVMSVLSEKIIGGSEVNRLAELTGMSISPVDGILLDLMYLLIILSTVSSAVIVSKISFFTLKNSLHVLVSVIMVMILIWMMPVILSIIEI